MSKSNEMIAGYNRVSSAEQKEEGISLSAQNERIKKYAEAQELKIFEIYKDEAKSAGTIAKRPQFRRMLEDAKLGKFKAIIITKFDRAFRNAGEAILTLDSLHAQGIDLISIEENIDTRTPFGRAMFQIISIFAELERQMTSSRVRAVNRFKFDNGLIIGRCPIGYKWSKQKKIFIIDERKANMVKDIFSMASQEIDYKEICKKYKIAPQQYYNILKNKSYVGIVCFEGKENKGLHQPIIEKEIFLKLNPNSDLKALE